MPFRSAIYLLEPIQLSLVSRINVYIAQPGRARSRCNVFTIVGGGLCPTSWNYYNGNCYYVSTDQVNHETARSNCQEMSADLTSISDQAEMDFVESIS